MKKEEQVQSGTISPTFFYNVTFGAMLCLPFVWILLSILAFGSNAEFFISTNIPIKLGYYVIA